MEGRKKNYFILALVLSLILHVVDFVTDVQFTLSMRDQPNYYNISIMIIFLTSVTNTSIGFLIHEVQMKTHPNAKIRNKFLRENALKKLCRLYFETLLGFFQVEVIIAGINSIRLGKKTVVFAAVRYMEGIIESCPESLLQLFILLRLRGSISYSESSTIILSLSKTRMDLGRVLATPSPRTHARRSRGKRRALRAAPRSAACPSRRAASG